MAKGNVEERGGCLIFAWGPPWTWRPKVTLRAKWPFTGGMSFVWLWWALFFVPRSVGSLLVYSEVYRELKARGSVKEPIGGGEAPITYRNLAPVSSCQRCPRWQMDRRHILIAIAAQRLFALMLVLFGVIYALPKDLEPLRPPLRLALLLSALVQAHYGMQLARHMQASIDAEERG